MLSKLRKKIQLFLFKKLGSNYKIKALRKWGAKVGKNCYIAATSFSTEPYLIEIGDHVAIASGTKLVTHDGSVWMLDDRFPNKDLFGTIKIGNNSHIGIDSIILPNTVIGSNCNIGAGSVVRGTIPDNSVAFGNPARVIMKTSLLETFILNHKHCLEIRHLGTKEKEGLIKKHFNCTSNDLI